MIALAAHGLEAMIEPACGAIVTQLRWRAPSGAVHDLLFSPPGLRPQTVQPNRFGLWPMVPFANRAFGGVVDDGHRRIRLPFNDPATGSAIHGFGWQAAWQVIAQEPDFASLRHERAAEASAPYAYAADLEIALEADGARVSLAVTNTGDEALPFGIGFHPWLPRLPDTVVTVRARRALVLGPGYRATGVTDLPHGGRFGAGAGLPVGEEVAQSLVDWTGDALFSSRAAGLSIAIAADDSLRHPVLWTPPDADFVCFEPQSHGIGAPSEPAARGVTPLAALAPGETLSGWMTIRAAAV
jgi:aldose 1-epimerase